MRLLLCEDERELSNAIAAILKHDHYSVDTVYDGEDALNYAMTQNYDGIILDIMMPKMNGIDVLKLLRSRGIDTPVLLLTAKAELDDKILGLDSGADDYLTKPFAMGELLARLRALTRRKSEFAPNKLTIGNISLTAEVLSCPLPAVRSDWEIRSFKCLKCLCQTQICSYPPKSLWTGYGDMIPKRR